ncbi:MAG: ABC transporter ATP-binding protein [Planctomycetes bacterium]|nr:ABC transporter ATP-binding protein [Planctomycetota bacterium]
MSEVVLTVRDLRASYPVGASERLEVLGGIDVSVARGEILALVGTSGCGKTTLLHVLSGLHAPSGGTIEGSRDSMAMVFQRPHLLPWRTVLDNATFGLECRGDVTDANAKASALLSRMGLGDHLADYPHQLSEGMKQRVNLARALLVEPEVLLLDEPFAALDVRTRRGLQEDLLELWGEQDLTIVLVSHSLDDVVYLSDRVGILSEKPTRLQELTEIDLPRPRKRGTLALLECVAALEAKLSL